MAPQPRQHSPHKPKGVADFCQIPKQAHHLPVPLHLPVPHPDASNKRKPISVPISVSVPAAVATSVAVVLITLIAVFSSTTRSTPYGRVRLLDSTIQAPLRGTISPESTHAVHIAATLMPSDSTNQVERAGTKTTFAAAARELQQNTAPPAVTMEDDGAWPKVAWLMSFPNSGTSYTLHLTRLATATTTATNYALEGDVKDKPSVPIHTNASTAGPFLELVRDRDTIVPKTYILTKTHCGGFCSDCVPENYLETPRSFQISCQTGRKAYLDKDGSLKTSPVTYDAGLVKKAVHVIRNPLDNIVARFHLDWKKYRDKGNNEWTAEFPYNVTGFHRWCKEMDRKNTVALTRWVDDKLAHLMEAIPCQEEFLRFIQWHNLAFSVTRDMGIPTHIINYHDYRDDWESTVTKLFNFLELTRTGMGEPFAHGKEYRSYYTPGDRLAIKAFIQEYASAETWEHVKDFDY